MLGVPSVPEPILRGAVLTIDTGAIAANWRDLAARHGRPTAAVVKADGYGLGARVVVRSLYDAGCRHFFVAHLSEALAIGDLIPGAMLAVLNGLLPGTAPELASRGILPVLGSLAEIADWSGEAARRGQALPALLHVDTGMARLGLDPAEWGTLLAEPGRLRGIDLRYLMTHLVAAEQPDDPLNALQLERFRAACARMPGVATSLANSSGLFLGAEYGSDLGRPGAALYGVNPTPGLPNPQRAVVALRVRVLQVRAVPAGAPVGYDATWVAARASRIATACVGYADGWPRMLSNRGCAFFDGQAVPLVGRVSMDLVTYDATDVPHLAAGDWLELIGPHCPVDEVARLAETNGYEILTSLGARYQRVIGTV
jgi:alanine racemase